MFRLSTHQMFLSSGSRVMDNSLKLNKLNNQISTGKKVGNPSDDPVAKRKIMHENRVMRENDGYQKNNSDARNHLESAEYAMRSVHEILDAVKTLTISMSNSTVTEEDRDTARDQVMQSMEDIVQYGNTEIDGFYIFGGYSTALAPFEQDGTYQGDDFARSLEIAPSVYKQVAFAGSEVLTGTVGGGVNVFSVLTELAENLLSDDTDAIQDRISELDQSLEQVGRYQSESGILLQEVEMSDVILQSDLIQSQFRKADLEDLDVAQAITEFSSVKTTLESTMAATSQMLQISLLSYLK